MGIPKGGILDQVVQDKISRIERKEMIINAVLAVLAIALAIISYGTATPFIAAAAAGGGLAISSYMAYDEYQQYVTEKDLSDVGFANDPSMFWLIVAVAAAALDMGAAVKAVRALGPFAKTFNASGDFAEFAQAVRSLSDAGEIEAKIAQAAEKAAAAKAAAKAASGDLARVFSSKGSVIKSLEDPETYKAMVRLASAKIKEGVNSFHHFVLELQKARRIANIAGDMSSKELAKAKEAWEQAVRLHKSAEIPLDIMDKNGKLVGRFSNGSHMEIISRRSRLHGGNTVKLDPNKTTTVTGTLNDVETLAHRGYHMPGSTVMGSNRGGINILRSPQWQKIQTKYKHLLDAGEELRYWKTVTDEFWSTTNKPWLDAAIKRGDDFRFISRPTDDLATYVTNRKGTEFILDQDGNKIRSIFGREVDYLTSKGYRFLPDGTAVAPK